MGRVMPVARSAPETAGGVAAIGETKADRSLAAAASITDILDLSPAAQQQSQEEQSREVETKTKKASDQTSTATSLQEKEKPQEEKAASPRTSSSELTAEDQARVAQLKARDTEVRAHEQAHLATAGQYAKGGASYSYETGPDGQRYAVGGEVSIDASPIKGDPDATISKAQQIRAAALAPASPSGQDYKVAAAASEMEATARLQKTSTVEGKPRVDRGQAISSAEIETETESSTESVASLPQRTAASQQITAAYLQQSKLSSRFSLFA